MYNEKVLESIFSNEEALKDVFGGTCAEAVQKLSNYGVVMTEDEVKELLMGVANGIKAEEAEMDEASLDQVVGGCNNCYNFGRGIVKTIKGLGIIRTVVEIVKYFI